MRAQTVGTSPGCHPSKMSVSMLLATDAIADVLHKEPDDLQGQIHQAAGGPREPSNLHMPDVSEKQP